MTFTTASGLLPAGIAVYVQRGPNGIGLETRYPVGLEDLTSLWERGRRIHYVHLPKEDGSSGTVHYDLLPGRMRYSGGYSDSNASCQLPGRPQSHSRGVD